MLDPKVSIIVPCYNQAIYLDECLFSVAQQTYSNWECIIVNDGSPDHTEEVAEVWCEKDVRFKYLRIENNGVSAARNKGIEIAKGEYVLPLDADDKINKNYISLAIERFKNDLSLKLVYGKAEKFGALCELWKLPQFSLKNLALDNIIYCSAVFKKKAWELISGYDVNMKKGLEDWEFWISLLKDGGKVYCLPETVFYYRIKNSSRQIDLSIDQKQELFEYISIKHADFFVKQLGSFQYLSTENRRLKSINVKNRYFKKQILNNFCEAFLGFSILKK